MRIRFRFTFLLLLVAVVFVRAQDTISIAMLPDSFSRSSQQYRMFEWAYDSLEAMLLTDTAEFTIGHKGEHITYRQRQVVGCSDLLRYIRQTPGGRIVEDIERPIVFIGGASDSGLEGQSFYVVTFEGKLFAKFEGFTGGTVVVASSNLSLREFGLLQVPSEECEGCDDFLCSVENSLEPEESGIIEDISTGCRNSPCSVSSNASYGYSMKTLELALTTDYEYFQINGEDYDRSLADLLAIAAGASYAYADYFNVRICVVAVQIRGISSPALTGGIREYVSHAFIDCASYDVCGLLTGKVQACGYTHGRPEDICLPYGNWYKSRFYSRRLPTIKKTYRTLTHELGHIFGALHTTFCLSNCDEVDGVYTIPSIMCPKNCEANIDEEYFDCENRERIRSKIRNGKIPCLDTYVSQPCTNCQKRVLESQVGAVSTPCTGDVFGLKYKLTNWCHNHTYSQLKVTMPASVFQLVSYDNLFWTYSLNSGRIELTRNNYTIAADAIEFFDFQVRAIASNPGAVISFHADDLDDFRTLTLDIDNYTQITGNTKLSTLLAMNPAIWNSSKISISGELEIDVDVSANDKLFILLNDASIRVTTNRTASFRRCTFRGCESLWRGIAVTSGSSIKMEYCRVEDAFNAVKLSTGAGKHYFLGNQFRDNFYSIICEGGAGPSKELHFLPGFVGNIFTSTRSLKAFPTGVPYSERPYAAIYLSNVDNIPVVGQNIAAFSPNEFSNMHYGIVLRHANMVLQGLFHFKNIPFRAPGQAPSAAGFGISAQGRGHSLYIDGDPAKPRSTFQGINYPILAQDINLRVRHVDIADATNGITVYKAQNRKAVVSGNVVSAREAGILVFQSPGSWGDIADNELTVLGTEYELTSGQSGIRIVDMDLKSDWKIYDNQIEVGYGSTGIHLMNVRGASVLRNQISRNVLTYKSFIGISLMNSHFSVVNCNEINSVSRPLHTGIHNFHSTNCRIECNEISGGMESHIRFSGACANTVMRGNSLSDYPLSSGGAILLTPFASMGNQLYAGNVFVHGQDIWNQNSVIWLIENSKIISSTTPYVNYPVSYIFPARDEDENDDWYSLDYGSPNYTCPEAKSNCQPGYRPNDPHPGDLEIAISKGDYKSGPYTGTMKEYTQYRLFRDLVARPDSLYSVDTILLSFRDSMAVTDAGRYQAALHRLDSLTAMSVSLVSAPRIVVDSISDRLRTLVTLAGTDLTTYSAIAYLDTIESVSGTMLSNLLVYDTIATIENGLVTGWRQYMQDSVLAGISNVQPGMELTSDMMDKYIDFMADTVSFVSAHESLHDEWLASLCYLEEGDGVFLQRGLSGIHPRVWEYTESCVPVLALADGDNSLVHAFQSGTMKVTEQMNSSGDRAGYICYPNPTTGVLHLQSILSAEAAVKLHISDIYGRIVWIGEHLGGHTRMDLSGLQDGVYFIRIGNSHPVIYRVMLMR